MRWRSNKAKKKKTAARKGRARLVLVALAQAGGEGGVLAPGEAELAEVLAGGVLAADAQR